MTVAQLLDQIEVKESVDVYKSREYSLRILNQVHKDLVENSESLTSTLSKTISTSGNTVDLSGDSVKDVAQVYMLNTYNTNWIPIPKAKSPVSVYPATTLSQWYWELIGETLTFNKTATADISIKVSAIKSATVLTDGTNEPDINIDSLLIDGTIRLLQNDPNYYEWLNDFALPRIIDQVRRVSHHSRRTDTLF